MDIVRAITEYDPSRILFLCGAGISYDAPTGLPTVIGFVYQALDACDAGSDICDAVARTMTDDQVAPRFEVLIDEIRKLRDPTLRVGRVFDSPTFNRIHHFLGRMLLKGASVLTTNFDNCIENSLKGCTRFSRAVFTGADLSASPPLAGVLVKVHGSNTFGAARAGRSDLVISIKALAGTAQGFKKFPKWRAYLDEVLRGKLVIVLGYSGSDDFDLTPVLLESEPERVLWFDYSAKHLFPVRSRYVVNPKVANFATKLPLRYFQGQLTSLLAELEKPWCINYVTRRTKRPEHTVRSYVASLFATPSRKGELINQILLHYSLYEMVVTRKLKTTSPEIVIQNMKALFRVSKHPESCELYEQYKHRFRSRSQRLQALYYYSASLHYLGRLDEAINVAQHQLAIARNADERASLIHSLNHLGALYSARLEYDRAEASYAEVLEPQNEGASIEGEATALWGLADLALVRDDDPFRAMNLYLRARGIYTELGNRFTLAWTDNNIGEALITMHRFDEAETALKRAEAAFREPHYPSGLIYALNAQSKMHYLRGNLELCAATVSEAVDMVEQQHGIPIALDVLMLYVCVMGKRGCRQELRARRTTLLIAVQGKKEDQRAKLLQSAISDHFRTISIQSLEKYLFD